MARVFLLGFLVAALTSSSVYSGTVAPTADTTSTAAPAQNTDSTTTDPATMPTAAGTPAPGETTPPPAPDTTTVMDSDSSTGATGTTMAGGDTSGSMSSSSTPGANTDAPSATESTTAGPDATTAAVVTDAPGNTETSTSAPESTTVSTAGNNTGSSTPADSVNTTTTPTSNGTATDATDSSAPPASSTPAPPASTTTTTATGEGETTTGSSSETDATATNPTVPSPSETSTDASTTTTTTPTPTTTTTPAPPVRPEGEFALTLPFGSSPGDVLSCSPCDAEAIKKAVEDKFGDIPGFLYVSIVEQQMRRRKRETKVTLRVVFNPTQLLEQLNQTARETIFADSINDLGNEAGISVNTTLSKSLAADFGEQTSSRCKISRACPAQYMCDDESQTCVHLCASETCSGNGKCQVEIGDDATPRAVCMCNSGYETTYTGDKCEESETSKSKIIAILGGVLGTFCAILLIIVIVLCCRQRGFGDSSSKYELSGRRGYSNNAYSDDVNMKKMG